MEDQKAMGFKDSEFRKFMKDVQKEELTDKEAVSKNPPSIPPVDK